MFKKLNLMVVCSLFILITLTSCTNYNMPDVSQSLNEEFLKNIALTDLNVSLQVAMDTTNPGKIENNNLSDIVVKNNSNSNIFLPDEGSIELYFLSEEGWLKINNNIEYHSINGFGGVLLTPYSINKLESQFPLNIEPNIDESMFDGRERGVIRIYIICEVMNNNNKSGKFIGAYLDQYIYKR